MIPIISIINFAIGIGVLVIAREVFRTARRAQNRPYFYLGMMFLFTGAHFLLIGSPGIITNNPLLIQVNYIISIFLIFLGGASLLAMSRSYQEELPLFEIWTVVVLGAIDAGVSLLHSLPADVTVSAHFIYYTPQSDTFFVYLNGIILSTVVLTEVILFVHNYRESRSDGAKQRARYMIAGSISLFFCMFFLYLWYPALQVWNLWAEGIFAAIWYWSFNRAIFREPVHIPAKRNL